MTADHPARPGSFFHGTRADVRLGDLIVPGFGSNYGAGRPAAWVYMAGTLEAAVWGAELAAGTAPERIYVVEPTGPIEDDPNLTDTKFRGNPTRSYRSREPLRVTGEVTAWESHSPERLQAMRDFVERMRAQNIEAID